jgi:hypothetical protein
MGRTLLLQHKNKKTMKGKYIKQNGEEVEILDFDAENKIVKTQIGEGQFMWHTENEYKTWGKVLPEDITLDPESFGCDPIGIDFGGLVKKTEELCEETTVSQQESNETPKQKKRTYKKKTK